MKPADGHPAFNLQQSTVRNVPVSAAMLTDQKSMKTQIANGISQNDFHSTPSKLPARRSSEPPAHPISSYSHLHLSVDDAYEFLYRKGHSKRITDAAGAIQTKPLSFNPRQLLDPKAFSAVQRKRDIDGSAPALKYRTSAEPESTNNNLKNEPSDDQERGMGNLIENIFNVTTREDHPRKKQKADHDGDECEEKKNKVFAGGVKGGEIGEYMKQKRKEGQEMSGIPNVVVDLTQGMIYHIILIFRIVS